MIQNTNAKHKTQKIQNINSGPGESDLNFRVRHGPLLRYSSRSGWRFGAAHLPKKIPTVYFGYEILLVLPVVYCIIYLKYSRDAEYIYTQVLSKERIPRYTCAIDKATGAGYFAWQQEFSPWQHVRPSDRQNIWSIFTHEIYSTHGPPQTARIYWPIFIHNIYYGRRC